MQEKFRDPAGFEATLTDACWAHITARHPVMEPFRESVAEAIRQPDGIHLGKRDPARRIYRKRYAHVPDVGDSLDLLVFVDGVDGYVATAYFRALSLRGLGDLIWPSE
ncbi:MAG: hypothetical protein DMG22_19405 [Acidobacteria bacterium]|nr:MAG: hypothetical protein DMG22_19405 [Acidobacteriota bacterium]